MSLFFWFLGEAADVIFYELLGQRRTSEENFHQHNAAHERGTDAEQRADEEIFRKLLAMELRVARYGFRSDDQAHSRRRMQQKRGQNEKFFKHAEVDTRVAQLHGCFAKR